LHYGAPVNRGIRESFRLISISFTRFKFNRFLRSNTSFLMRQTSRFWTIDMKWQMGICDA
jgi:hypothetical protein